MPIAWEATCYQCANNDERFHMRLGVPNGGVGFGSSNRKSHFGSGCFVVRGSTGGGGGGFGGFGGGGGANPGGSLATTGLAGLAGCSLNGGSGGFGLGGNGGNLLAA
jgi:hypothetical protein